MRRKHGSIRSSAIRPAVLLLAAVLVTALPYCAMQQAAPHDITYSSISREYTIKAAYLYNFALYVRWPAGSFRNEQDPLVIGVLGTDPFGDNLKRIARVKKIEDRRLVIRHFDSLDEYSPCHILFVPRSVEPERQLKVIRRLRNSPVLLVGETPKFAERGGTVNFFIQQNKIRFEVNRQAVERTGLKISAKLLSLAKLVDDDSAEERPAADVSQPGPAVAR